MQKLITCFVRDESGATAIEYAYIVAFIALIIIGSLFLLGPELKNTFSDVQTDFEKRSTL